MNASEDGNREMVRASNPRPRVPVTAIVMTFNEERNLRACLESVASRIEKVFVVDCGSTDATQSIAREFGCEVVFHPWTRYATQFQWALDSLPIPTDWVIRLDADERWTDEGFAELEPLLARAEVAGIHVRMRIMFMGRWLRRGGLYPNNFLRVFRRKGAAIEQRWMDEHIRVPGLAVETRIDVIESNYDRQQNIGKWTDKHNRYSTNEAIDTLIQAHRLAQGDTIADRRGESTARKRWLKEQVYRRMPPFLGPALYFLYRYVVKLGFLDGTPGFVFHVLQGFWYRFLVDVKVRQLQDEARRRGLSIPEIVKDTYGVEI